MVKLEEDTDWSYTALPSLSKCDIALLRFIISKNFYLLEGFLKKKTNIDAINILANI